MKPLPCPFCGKAPETFPKDPKTEGNAWGEVVCTNRRCVTYDWRRVRGVSVRDGAFQNDERGSAAYIAAAVRRWNKRTAPTKETTP